MFYSFPLSRRFIEISAQLAAMVFPYIFFSRPLPHSRLIRRTLLAFFLREAGFFSDGVNYFSSQVSFPN